MEDTNDFTDIFHSKDIHATNVFTILCFLVLSQVKQKTGTPV
ncbi:hypothetical protein [Dellaglioa algida]|nr:hypothetical protein [Dellaglioa algida]MDK1723577.1 hypothetical protein [Dellaglioa algida]